MIFSYADILMKVWVAVVCVALAFVIIGGVLILIVIRKYYLRYVTVTVTVNYYNYPSFQEFFYNSISTVNIIVYCFVTMHLFPTFALVLDTLRYLHIAHTHTHTHTHPPHPCFQLRFQLCRNGDLQQKIIDCYFTQALQRVSLSTQSHSWLKCK